MSPKLLKRLLIAQTVLLVLVGWAGVYFARDEYQQATRPTDSDEGLAKAAATSEDDGVPTVRLSVAAQRNVGIEVAMPEPAQFGGEATVPVVVMDAQPLVELQGRLRAARADLDAARSAASASVGEQRRVQALFDDDRNASQRALDAAKAQAASDAARARGAESSFAALRESTRLQWGSALARELEGEAGGALVARLSSGRELLLRALLRGDQPAPERAQLVLDLPGRSTPVTAQPLGAAGGVGAAVGGESAGGRSLLFRAQLGTGRAPIAGQRLQGQLRDAGQAAQAGVLLPASAIVWHAGQPWIYVRESNEPQPVDAGAPVGAAPAASAAGGKDSDDDDKPRGREPRMAAASSAGAAVPVTETRADTMHAFQRRAVPRARRIGDRWFLQGYAEDDPVVVRGAQVLLSEELKYQIRNENDD